MVYTEGIILIMIQKDQFPDLLKFLICEKQTMKYIMENGNTGKKHKDVESNTNKLIQEPRESNMVDLLLQNQRQSAGYIKDITL